MSLFPMSAVLMGCSLLVLLLTGVNKGVRDE
ncbi:Uncharacterised protein [Serratia proteamaculans]|nr:Uncharacterised protein [Serratia proteamaculans]CAI1700871.1 Uncharacterised protein [Serratia proteamaculans]